MRFNSIKCILVNSVVSVFWAALCLLLLDWSSSGDGPFAIINNESPLIYQGVISTFIVSALLSFWKPRMNSFLFAGLTILLSTVLTLTIGMTLLSPSFSVLIDSLVKSSVIAPVAVVLMYKVMLPFLLLLALTLEGLKKIKFIN